MGFRWGGGGRNICTLEEKPLLFRPAAFLSKGCRYRRVPAACAIIIPLLVIENAARSFLCLPDITSPFCCVQGNVSPSDQIRRNISSFLLLIDK